MNLVREEYPVSILPKREMSGTGTFRLYRVIAAQISRYYPIFL